MKGFSDPVFVKYATLYNKKCFWAREESRSPEHKISKKIEKLKMREEKAKEKQQCNPKGA